MMEKNGIPKRYEILKSLPAYGAMYIPISENNIPFYHEGFAVRFYKTDQTQWVANFQQGWTDLKGVFEFIDTPNLLIIAFGTCYLMNPDQIKPLAIFGITYLKAFATENNKLILQDSTNFTVVESNGNYWETEQISWDGFAEIELNKNIITGLAYTPTHETDESSKFSYNIDTKDLIIIGVYK